MGQRLANLEQNPWQRRLAMEEDVPADKEIHERTEGVATAVQAMHRDSWFANRVDPDPKCSTSFGDKFTEPPALPCSRDDALEGDGSVTVKSCISSLEIRNQQPSVAYSSPAKPLE